MERELESLGLERERLAAEVDASRSDHQALASLGAELEAVQARLAACEEDWLRLSEELEALDGPGRR